MGSRAGSPSHSRVGIGFLRGFMGDYGHLRNLTTNQKVAGSSPAERALKSPAKVGFFFCGKMARAVHYHLFTTYGLVKEW